MPVCTNCAYPADYVYTTYKTKSNIRLGVCQRCDQFLDPLIEHPDLIILLDLVLLKPRVFLHLLFNRGSPPFDADKDKQAPVPGPTLVPGSKPPSALQDVAVRRASMRGETINEDLWKLAVITVLAETTLRLLPTFNHGADDEAPLRLKQVAVTAGVVILEGFVQHGVTLALALAALRLRGWFPPQSSLRSDGSGKERTRDGRRENFLPSLIPLTILYTSLLPLLLQLLLSIWYTPPRSIHEPLPTGYPTEDISVLSTLLSIGGMSTAVLPAELLELERGLIHAWVRSDRIWAGTKLLGGMSAGFGLRVLLPTKPWETTAIILAGWTGAALVSTSLHRWVG